MHLTHCDPVVGVASLLRISSSRLGTPTMAFVYLLTSPVESTRDLGYCVAISRNNGY